MLSKLYNDKVFSKLISKHIASIINHLLNNGYHFGILCYIDRVTFTPSLPKSTQKEFHPLTLFYLAGYTFESAKIDGDYLYFEAGFGAKNIGSLVTVPLNDIIQIILDEIPIFINSTTKFILNMAEQEVNAREESLSALMANPKNKKLIDKKK